MIPETELKISFIYGKRYDSKFHKDYIKDIKGKFANFIKLYKENISQILKLIEKNNEPWKLKYIPIYLTLDIKPFSDPLTIRYEKNEKYLLVVLIHELIHNNITKRFEDRDELHKFIQDILLKVCKEINLNLNKEIEELDRKLSIL